MKILNAKKIIIFSGVMLVAGAKFLSSCSKDEDEKPGNPTMSFLVEDGYVSEKTNAGFGDPLRFMVYNDYNGTDVLAHFKASRNGGALMDSIISKTKFTIEIIVNKTVEASEVWKFEVTDNAGNKTDYSLTVTGDFGPKSTGYFFDQFFS